MSITTKFYIMMALVFGFMCLLAYELYQVYGVTQNNRKLLLDFTKNKAEAPFVPMPIELPQNEVVILQPREIELPKAKEVMLPTQNVPKQNIIIKGATSALVPNSSGVIK